MPLTRMREIPEFLSIFDVRDTQVVDWDGAIQAGLALIMTHILYASYRLPGPTHDRVIRRVLPANRFDSYQGVLPEKYYLVPYFVAILAAHDSQYTQLPDSI